MHLLRICALYVFYFGLYVFLTCSYVFPICCYMFWTVSVTKESNLLKFPKECVDRIVIVWIVCSQRPACWCCLFWGCMLIQAPILSLHKRGWSHCSFMLMLCEVSFKLRRFDWLPPCLSKATIHSAPDSSRYSPGHAIAQASGGASQPPWGKSLFEGKRCLSFSMPWPSSTDRGHDTNHVKSSRRRAEKLELRF